MESDLSWTKNSFKEIIDHFTIHTENDVPYDYKEYLRNLANSYYGLCIPENHSKSNRLIEYLSMGTVPIVVNKSVNTSSFQEPLIENEHFIALESELVIPSALAQISDERWKQMSTACHEWYYRNVHSDNSFKNLYKQLLEENIPLEWNRL